jgi:hypothetical protein
VHGVDEYTCHNAMHEGTTENMSSGSLKLDSLMSGSMMNTAGIRKQQHRRDP